MPETGKILDPRFDNTGNRNNTSPKGCKRTVTLVKELYEGALLAVSQHRIKDIVDQVARDAVDEDKPDHIRQKAQQMIIQAAQKAGDQAIEAEKMDKGMDGLEIDISRDGVLIRQGRNQVRIDGGGSFKDGGVHGETVPYSPYPTTQNSSYPSPQFPDNPNILSPDLDTYTGLRGEKYMLCSPGSSIPLTEFVGPPRDPKILQQLFLPRKHNDPYLNPEMKYKEYLCIDRPVSMNFNVEVIDDC